MKKSRKTFFNSEPTKQHGNFMRKSNQFNPVSDSQYKFFLKNNESPSQNKIQYNIKVMTESKFRRSIHSNNMGNSRYSQNSILMKSRKLKISDLNNNKDDS